MIRSRQPAGASPFANASAVVATQVVGSLLWLATISVLANRMDDPEFGSFLYLFAFAAGLEALTDAGLRFTVVTRLAAEADGISRSTIFYGAAVAKVFLSIVTAGVFLCAVLLGLVQVDSWAESLTTIAVLLTLPSTNPLVWVLRSANMQWLEGALLVIYRIVVAAAAALILSDLLCAACVLSVLAGANLLYYAMVFRPSLRVLRPFRRVQASAVLAEARALVRDSIGFGSSLLFSQFSARFWVMLLGYFSLNQELVAVSTSQMVIQSILLLGVALGSSYLPYLGETVVPDVAAFARIAKSLVVAGLGAGVAFGIGVHYSASIIMRRLFDQQSAASADILGLLAFLSPIILLSFVLRYILSAAKLNKQEFWATLAGLGPAVALAPFVLQWGGVTQVLVLYLLGEFATLCIKTVIAHGKVGFHARELLGMGMTTFAVLIAYGVAVDAWFPASMAGDLAGLLGAASLVVAVCAIFVLFHYSQLQPMWRIARKSSP